MIFTLKQATTTINNMQNHEATTHNDDKALIDKSNNKKLCGSYGLHTGTSVIAEMQRLKIICSEIKFRWVKGH